VQQIARGNAIDVGKPSIRTCLQVETCQQLEQAVMGAVRDRYRQRFFIESLDVAADQIAQQSIQSPLFGIVPAQAFEFLLEGPEGSQPVVLARKPTIKIVHISLFR